MGLKDVLGHRQPRTITVPLLVSDPGEELRRDAAKAAERADLAELAVRTGTDTLGPAAEKFREDANVLAARLAEHYVDVQFTAVTAAAWEEMLNAHRRDDGDLADTALPVMLAACAVDENLQDPDWWDSQLRSPAWTFGEREALRGAVLAVNGYAPRPGLGKG